MTMKKAFLCIGIAILSVAVIVACGAVFLFEFGAEANFNLANESRLPRWFTIPPGHTRADVSVSMSTYIVVCGGCSLYILWDHNGRPLKWVHGKDSNALSLNNSPKDFYPAYTASTVNGITEIIENRKPEPLFYITDNPVILRKVLDSQPIPSSK